jgi:hypothetical protein
MVSSLFRLCCVASRYSGAQLEQMVVVGAKAADPGLEDLTPRWATLLSLNL